MMMTPRRELRVVRLSMVEGGEEEDVIYEGEKFSVPAERANGLTSCAQCCFPAGWLGGPGL